MAYNRLLEWKASKLRKPLLIRGGRQVGKTTLIREFAKEFGDYIELSLEKGAERNLFERTDEISKLLSSIYLIKQKVINFPDSELYLRSLLQFECIMQGTDP